MGKNKKHRQALAAINNSQIAVTRDELAPGLAMHMSPAVIEERADTYFYGRHRSVPFKHRWWICTAVDVDTGRSAWSPTYSNDYEHRTPVHPARGSTVQFLTGTFAVDPGTVVVLTVSDLNDAARAGNDLSRYGERCHFAHVPPAAAGTGAKAIDGVSDKPQRQPQPQTQDQDDMTTDNDDEDGIARYLVMDFRGVDTTTAIMTEDGLRQWIARQRGVTDIVFHETAGFMMGTEPVDHENVTGVLVLRLHAWKIVKPVVRTVVDLA